MEIKVFAKGTIARCNRCGRKAPLPRDRQACRENSKAFRLTGMCTLDCGHMDAHWVFVTDNQE